MHATISDLITDLVQNSIEANATEITLSIKEIEKKLSVVIADNGKGMSAETVEKVKDPFFTDGKKHKHRKVGLGLPFLYQTAEATGGIVQLESKEGNGTTLSFTFDSTHVDLPMFGSFTTAATTLMTYGFNGNLTIKRSIGTNSYEVSKNELTEVLGNLNDLDGLTLLKQFITSQEEELKDNLDW